MLYLTQNQDAQMQVEHYGLYRVHYYLISPEVAGLLSVSSNKQPNFFSYAP